MYYDSETMVDFLDSASSFEAREGHILFVCLHEKFGACVPAFIQLMNAKNITLVGGIFPGLISEGELKEKGAIVQYLPVEEAPVVIKNLSSGVTFPNGFGKSIEKSASKDYTAFVLVDGLSSGVAQFTSLLHDKLGDKVVYFGGGAGSLSLVQEPCIFSNEGIVADAAVVFISSLSSSLGVRHGWKRVAGPFVATKTCGNAIIELNWENALGVYKGIVEQDSGEQIDPYNFFSHSKSYPFGIFREGQEDVIRDPIKTNEEGHLICVGEVAENSILYIMNGDEETLLESAELASKECCNQMRQNKGFSMGFVADCISRVLFLEEAFNRELEIVDQSFRSFGNIETEGILTLGEISSFGRGYLEFLNKTLVAAILYEREGARNKSDRRDFSTLRNISQHRYVS